MRFCFDIDGVIAKDAYIVGTPADWHAYWRSREVFPQARLVLEKLQRSGHEILLYTARFEQDRLVTEEWLLQHQIPYDKLYMSKPRADLYIDDKNLRFPGWGKLLDVLQEAQAI